MDQNRRTRNWAKDEIEWFSRVLVDPDECSLDTLGKKGA